VFGRDVAGLDAVRIEITGSSTTAMFVGIASEAAVDSWLAGTAHDELAEVYGRVSDVRMRRSVGSVRPVPPPAEQTFWLASATGVGPLLVNWAPGDGRLAVVVANANGSVGVTTEGAVGVRVPVLRPLGYGLLAGGTFAGLVAIALIYIGAVGLGGPGVRAKSSAQLPPGPADRRSADRAGGSTDGPGAGPPVRR
jgi:hypothetical protein